MSKITKITLLFLFTVTLSSNLYGRDHCRKAIDKTISCIKDKSVRLEMTRDKREIIYHCRKDRYEIRRAKNCNKFRFCSNFLKCVRGGE